MNFENIKKDFSYYKRLQLNKEEFMSIVIKEDVMEEDFILMDNQ